MQLDAILEVVIGLIFTWLILSVATMQIQEWFGTWRNWRADELEETIGAMFKDKRMAAKFYEHPLIKELYKETRRGKIRKPDFIPPEVFSSAAFDTMMNMDNPAGMISANSMSVKGMQAGMKKMDAENPQLANLLRHLLTGFYDKAMQPNELLSDSKLRMENWFGQVMDNASAQYKCRSQKWAFAIGLTLALIFNVDTLDITEQLWREPTVRAALVAQAANYKPAADAQTLKGDIADLFAVLTIPVGWTTSTVADSACGAGFDIRAQMTLIMGGECRVINNLPAFIDIWGWFLKVLGIAVSGAAAAQGAPFWFDLLRKAVSLREQRAENKE